MAHELGHLLLGPDSQAETGIMQPKWPPQMVHLAEKGVLKFTPDQAGAMRAEIERQFRFHAPAVLAAAVHGAEAYVL